MDDTLCDTKGANEQAQEKMARMFESECGIDNGDDIAQKYVQGIYRQWSPEQEQRYLPIAEQESEGAFRVQLITDLVTSVNGSIDDTKAEKLQNSFDLFRIEAFDFFAGIPEFLQEARKYFVLVVITNGPEFSQLPKLEAVKMSKYVDHIIVGGQEPEQKPAKSIFKKALSLADCEAHEAIHIGDSLAADVAGAHGIGITSVWVQHQQPLDAELGINPSHSVVQPIEVPEIIKKLHPF